MTVTDRLNTKVQYYTLKLLLIIARRLLYKNFTAGEDRDDTLVLSELNTFLINKFERGASMSALDLLTTRLIQDDFQPNLDNLQKEGAIELASLRAENERLKAELEHPWQPISSAPIGQRVLLGSTSYVWIAYVDSIEHRISGATYYMLLPKPPKEEK